MKRSKKLYTLLGIFIIICIVTIAVTQIEESKEQIKATGEIILEIPRKDVRSLSWVYNENSLAFHKDEKWLYDEDESFPVDGQKIEDLLEPFESFGVSFTIEDVNNYSTYGLDDPECVIQFATDDQVYTIQLGSYSKMDEERYFSIGDGNVYLAKKDPLDVFNITLNDLIKHDEKLSYQQITEIKFEGAENYTVFLAEESDASYSSNDIYFTEQNNKTLPLDTKQINNWLQTVSTLSLTNFVTYHATDEELESYHLTDPELTVTISYTAADDSGKEVDGTYILSVSRNPDELAAAEEAEANNKEAVAVTAYIRIGDSRIVYKISEYSSNRLCSVSYNDLRHREVLPIDFDDVYQIDFELEDSNYTIIADGKDKDTQERIWKYEETVVETETLQKELTSLKAGDSDDFTLENPSEKNEISFTVYLENKNHPKIKVALYRYNGEQCLAVVDGKPFALISRSDAVDLIEAVHAIVLN